MNDWKPAGWFRVALRAQENGDYERALRMYQKVLQASPDHVSALSNLATVQLRLLRFDAAQQTLHRLHENRGFTQQMDADKWPELVYSWLYNRALAHTLAAQRNGEIDPEQAGKAVGPATRLVVQVLTRLVAHDRRGRFVPRRRRPSRVDTEELRLLERIESQAVGLLADVVLRDRNNSAAWQLAARSTLQPRGVVVSRKALLEAAKRAVESEDIKPQLACDAERYARARAGSDARAYYNLACYRSEILQSLPPGPATAKLRRELRAAAFDDLGRGLTDDALLTWAGTDPALSALRTPPGYWKRFISVQQAITLDLDASSIDDSADGNADAEDPPAGTTEPG